MGLMIHSLGELPLEAKRAYYIYLLDYGWQEPLADAIYHNFDRMAHLASQSDAVVIRGIVGSHFADEVFSWHSINGQPGEEILPAVLITTIHPGHFKSAGHGSAVSGEDKLLLIPLRRACKDTKDVVSLIEKLFKDVKEKRGLPEFSIAKELKKGQGGALVDAIILQPNFVGLGLDLKKIAAYFRGLRGG
jgi:hypothetical protein